METTDDQELGKEPELSPILLHRWRVEARFEWIVKNSPSIRRNVAAGKTTLEQERFKLATTKDDTFILETYELMKRQRNVGLLPLPSEPSVPAVFEEVDWDLYRLVDDQPETLAKVANTLAALRPRQQRLAELAAAAAAKNQV